LKGGRSSHPPQPKKGGVIEKIHRLSFDLRIFRPFDHRIIIRYYHQISQQTDSNQRGGNPCVYENLSAWQKK